MTSKNTINKKNKNATLFFITGPMFSGKSTALIRKIKYLISQGKKTILFKPSTDNRSNENYVNCHNLLHHKAITINTAKDALIFLKKNKVQRKFVFFSEINFFSLDFIDVIKQILNKNISVVCGGLTNDYQNNIFPVSEQLLKLADKINFCYAGCSRCFKKANMSQRIIADTKNVILVGGRETYAPVCAACFS